MPIYEYKCGVCGHKFDKLVQKMDGEPKTKCPKCGKTAEKIDSVPSPFQWG